MTAVTSAVSVDGENSRIADRLTRRVHNPSAEVMSFLHVHRDFRGAVLRWRKLDGLPCEALRAKRQLRLVPAKRKKQVRERGPARLVRLCLMELGLGGPL